MPSIQISIDNWKKNDQYQFTENLINFSRV